MTKFALRQANTQRAMGRPHTRSKQGHQVQP